MNFEFWSVKSNFGLSALSVGSRSLYGHLQVIWGSMTQNCDSLEILVFGIRVPVGDLTLSETWPYVNWRFFGQKLKRAENLQYDYGKCFFLLASGGSRRGCFTVFFGNFYWYLPKFCWPKKSALVN